MSQEYDKVLGVVGLGSMGFGAGLELPKPTVKP